VEIDSRTRTSEFRFEQRSHVAPRSREWRFAPLAGTIPATMAKRARSKAVVQRKAASGKRSSSTAGKLPKEAVTLIVVLKARGGQESLLEAELRALVGPTRREDGCITYDLHRGSDVLGAFLLHEVWASPEHHRLHTLTPHFVRWNARKDALLASRDVTFWTQVA
jgi:quinol monooxygenase YgiN